MVNFASIWMKLTRKKTVRVREFIKYKTSMTTL